jgi:uncharacterized protein with von Willebrand factor type A (vWA) domain
VGSEMCIRDRSREVADEDGTEMLTGVTFGDNLQRLTPQARQLPPMLFAKRYLDQRLAQWRYCGTEKNQGPIVVAVDESGSMSGERIVMAKAVALALLQTCINEDRAFALVRFDNSAVTWLVEDPRDVKFDELERNLQRFLGGGTNIRAAFLASKEAIEKLGPNADVVLITDADGVQDEIAEWRHETAKLHGIMLEARITEEMQAVCQSLVELDDASLTDASRIKTVLTI